PVESSHFVRTVVCAVAGTDTTVISHLVEAFGAMRSSRHGTNCLTRCIVTLLTHHRHEGHLWILGGLFQPSKVIFRCVAAVVLVYSDPMHFPAISHFGFSYYRHVVFSLASDSTSAAS